MSWYNQADAPESVKHHSGRDPSDSGYCSICDKHRDEYCECSPCLTGDCDHVQHCNACDAPMDYKSPSGYCAGCDVRWLAGHQLLSGTALDAKQPRPDATSRIKIN
jgi:hypothetical protein